MKQVAVATANVLEFAGSVSGLPYVGAASQLLSQIIVTCDNVRLNKRKATTIKMKCQQLKLLLEEEVHKMEGTDLLGHIDEAVSSLDSISSRMSRVARAKSWELWKSNSIDELLDRCEQDLEVTESKFNVKTQLTIAASQQEVVATTTSTHEAVTELKVMVHKLVNSGLLPRQMETSLTNVDTDSYVQLMEAGQQGLHSLKHSTPSRLIIASGLTSSPLSSPPSSRAGSADAVEVEKLQGVLFNFHVKTGTLPTIKVLNDEIVKLDATGPVDGGVYSDIWLGKWVNRRTVALKVLRNTKANHPKAQERFQREVEMWSTLRHGNILPLWGIVTNIGNLIHMVSPWQENGNIKIYVQKHPHTNRLALIRGAANGLEYLHANKIVHGNVTCNNILVTDEGEACISDFGMAKLVEEVTEMSASATLTSSGSARWLAPELMVEGSRVTFSTDTYSFGMTILELVTGKYPFAERRKEASVIIDIMNKKVPRRPEEVKDDRVWKLLTNCWQHEPTLRPAMAEVNTRLGELL